ncbi:MAG TPA: hypothetical protein VJZ75_01585 [Candidatus Bathyarchaeia archaeon]|nr:hypothetical protein [Candidatus Bathyarchaeia archaeon]
MLNLSEQFVYDLCKKSFLSLWSYPNPVRQQDNKELCDILVVCDPYIVILSVKKIHYHTLLDKNIAVKRWERRAINESVKQVYRAQGWITGGKKIVTCHKGREIKFPDLKDVKIHRVAVALGSQGEVTISPRDFGKGFVHVYDEISAKLLIRELDTITDFVEYLAAVETLLTQNKKIVVTGGAGEEDLLAFYLQNNRSFPSNFGILVMDGTFWKGFSASSAFKARKEADRISYLWDTMIETFATEVLAGKLEYESNPSETELALRTIAKEHRFERRILSQLFDDLITNTPKDEGKARLTRSTSGVTYVFLVSPRTVDRETRRSELGLRCYVARSITGDHIVVGIVTEHYDPSGYSFDACYLRIDDWKEANQKWAEETQQKFRFFINVSKETLGFAEYPSSVPTSEGHDYSDANTT